MKTFQIAVIGGGHAGCEAALACARMGIETIMFAIQLESIASMPCNPNIGGSSKGHLVKEVDALGGEMARNIDKTFIQSRMLNKSKGPAVYSLRVQADKYKYASEMKRTLDLTPHLTLKQAEIVDILTETDDTSGNKIVTGVVTDTGIRYAVDAVIICSGTYLNSRCLCGDTITSSGPGGNRMSLKLSETLKRMGIQMYRFKTGTPARISEKSIDFSKMEAQNGDIPVEPFSFETAPGDVQRDQAQCFLTYTNENTHNIIRENIHRSPMYTGVIEGTGARYCPSIEDKIVRFPDKDRHQVFIEPEGIDSGEMYVSGMSTSLPEDVQIKMYRSLPGMEHCFITRNGYAIEYDCIDATQLKLSLEFKGYRGLFSAGQINGSSGYEEAAAQGIIAGINAACFIKNQPPLIIDRSEGYIGVLIDDLVTKGSNEPYRMMTSRAEYRLLLRQDNADARLTEKGFNVGLISEERFKRATDKQRLIHEEIKRLNSLNIAPSDELNAFLVSQGSVPITTGVKMSDLIRRPELSYEILLPFDPLYTDQDAVAFPYIREVNTEIKYEGYINKQIEQVKRFKHQENIHLPEDMDYMAIEGLRLEARQKLSRVKPASIGQASRISGVTPADISVLMIALRSYTKTTGKEY